MLESFFGELAIGVEVDEFTCFLVNGFEFSFKGNEISFIFFLVKLLKVFDLCHDLLFEGLSGNPTVIAFLWMGFGKFSIFAHVVAFIGLFPVCFGDAAIIHFVDGSAVTAGDESGEGFVFWAHPIGIGDFLSGLLDSMEEFFCDEGLV